jgi:DNA-binding MarR family transcriptional regulator
MANDSQARAVTVIRLAKVVELLLARHGLTVNQYRMLTFADDAPPLGEVAVRLAMKAPNVTAMIDGLVERGLLVRTRRADDRRRVDLALTASGRRVLQTAARQCNDALEQLAAKGRGDAARRLRGLDDWVEPLDRAAVELHTAATVAQRRRR